MKNAFIVLLALGLAAGALLLFGADLPPAAIVTGGLSGVAVIGVTLLVYWRSDRKAALTAVEAEEPVTAARAVVPATVDVAAWARRLREQDAMAADRDATGRENTQTSLDSERLARVEKQVR